MSERSELPKIACQLQRSLDCSRRVLSRALSARLRKLKSLDPPHRLEAALLIESACRGIVSIEMTEQTLKLGDLVVANVVPDFEDRAVRPKVPLSSPMTSEASPNPAGRCHSDVHDLISLFLAAPCGYVAVQDVDAS